jgi:hypothetical protein
MDDRRSALAGTIVKVILSVSHKIAKKVKYAKLILEFLKNHLASCIHCHCIYFSQSREESKMRKIYLKSH